MHSLAGSCGVPCASVLCDVKGVQDTKEVMGAVVRSLAPDDRAGLGADSASHR